MNESFSPNATRNAYREVHVLLLNWEGGDRFVREQLLELRDVFQDQYHFETEVWAIPSARPFRELDDKLTPF